jgi:prolyl-tRNA synthetase
MAAVVEQGGDDAIIWPREIAPYDVHVLVLSGGDEEIAARGEDTAASLEQAGLDVLLDDRPLRPGEKFADADLIGCPLRVIVGKKTLEDGAVDVRFRTTGEEERVAGLELANRVVGGP